jgi:glutamine synthetase
MLNAALVAMDAAAIINEMTKLRVIVDDLEQIVDDQKWPLPKYREMLFLY